MQAAETSILRIQFLQMISVSSTRSGVSTPQAVLKLLSLALEMHIITSTLLVYGCASLSLSQCIWKCRQRYASSLTPPTSKDYNVTFKYTLLDLLPKYSANLSCMELLSLLILFTLIYMDIALL